MIAVDTNMLAYAHRSEYAVHERAKAFLTSLAQSGEPWAIPWPCVHEFVSVVTNQRIFKNATSPRKAFEQLENWFESPSLRLIGEREGYFPILKSVVEGGMVTGPRVHDARILAICLSNGVTQLCSADRDFSKLSSSISLVNPL